MIVPKHYDKKVQPWDLERCMESSGDAFVDSRRTDAIEYLFRNKDNMLEDLKKARHCIDAAIERMEEENPGVRLIECCWNCRKPFQKDDAIIAVNGQGWCDNCNSAGSEVPYR